MARTSRSYRKLEAEKGMKTALYARISVTEDTSCISRQGNTSIDNQVALMMSYIRDKAEFELVKTYVDTNVSGATFDKQAFEEMM